MPGLVRGAGDLQRDNGGGPADDANQRAAAAPIRGIPSPGHQPGHTSRNSGHHEPGGKAVDSVLEQMGPFCERKQDRGKDGESQHEQSERDHGRSPLRASRTNGRNQTGRGREHHRQSQPSNQAGLRR